MPHALLNILTQAISPLLARSGNIVVAYSGGLDSSVLLHLLRQLTVEQGLAPSRLIALHVHHGLSANADAWAQHCAGQCAQWDIPFICERVAVNNRGDGVEQAAREARYAVFNQYCQPGDTLLLAHHADDQAETFFMRLLRGSGLTGLAAMAAQRELTPGSGIVLLRPLLACHRAALEAYAAEHQLDWIEDESNRDPRFERNLWRNTLLPQLFAHLPEKETVLQRSIKQLQQDQQLLQELLQPALESCLRPCYWPLTANLACSVPALTAAPAHHRPYLLRGWLARCGIGAAGNVGADVLRRIEQEVIQAAADRQPQLQIGRFTLRRFQQALYLVSDGVKAAEAMLPGMMAEPRETLLQADVRLPWAGAEIASVAPAHRQRSVAVRPGIYQLVPAAACRGKTLKTAGRPRKTLKHLWQEAGVPPWLRECWPVLLQEGELCALVGLYVGEGASPAAQATPENQVFLQWTGIF